MSKLWRLPRASALSVLRFSASAMVRPITNCPASTFMPWRKAARITGSPRRRTARESICPSAEGESTRPVSMKAKEEALTSRLSACPRWLCQSAPASLSSISLSAVAASGMRSSASARQRSATPSRVPRPNSARKAETSAPGRWARRADSTRETARARTRMAASGARVASATRGPSTASSGARCSRRRAARCGSGARGGPSGMAQDGAFASPCAMLPCEAPLASVTSSREREDRGL